MSEPCDECGAFYCEYLLDGSCAICAVKRLANETLLKAENAKLKEEIKVHEATIRVLVKKLNEANRSY